MSKLEGQVLILTGGGAGLGQAIVRRFINEGAKVAVLDKSPEALECLQDTFGNAIITLEGDVRSYSDNERLVSECISSFGKIDVAIGSAAIWDFSVPLTELSGEVIDRLFDEIFQINVKGCIHLASAAMKPLARSRGSLIYTVSNAGFYPAGGGVLYTATKHALVGLIRQLAYECAPYIRVNGVAPGPIKSSLTGPESLGMQGEKIPEKRLIDGSKKILPIGVLPEPYDYTGAYVLFASREDNIPATGSVLNFDGGFAARGAWQTRGGDDLLEKLGIES